MSIDFIVGDRRAVPSHSVNPPACLTAGGDVNEDRLLAPEPEQLGGAAMGDDRPSSTGEQRRMHLALPTDHAMADRKNASQDGM